MENFNFYSPTYFAFGKDRENDCGELVKRFGGTKVMIHFGGGSVVRSGLLDRVKASLTKASIEFVELGAKEEDITKLANRCCYGNGNESGKIGGFVSLGQSDIEAIYKLMVF